MEEQNTTLKIMLFLMMGFIVINLFILDIKLFSKNEVRPSALPNPRTENTLPTTAINNINSCPIACIRLISETTLSANTIISPQPFADAQGKPTTYLPAQTGNSQLTTNTPIPAAKTLRENYIPLGSGTTTKSEWTDLTGTETIIDTASYGTVQEAQLTYALRNPTQNGKVGVRLYNVTDKYVVYGSEAELEGTTAQTINTARFAFPTGNKLYRVQMRSTLQFDAYLDNARLKIVSSM